MFGHVHPTPQFNVRSLSWWHLSVCVGCRPGCVVQRRAATSLVVSLATVACGVMAAPRFHRAMPWMCLERCGDDIQAELADITKYHASLTGVSYEAFDLGMHGDLIDNGFTKVCVCVLQACVARCGARGRDCVGWGGVGGGWVGGLCGGMGQRRQGVSSLVSTSDL
jgi:hypothetical protein